MEAFLAILAFGVLGVGAIGWLWIVFLAFNEGDIFWGVACLLISPLCLVYAVLNFEEAKIPLILVLVGGVARIGIALTS